jgi:hypothetical protein
MVSWDIERLHQRDQVPQTLNAQLHIRLTLWCGHADRLGDEERRAVSVHDLEGGLRIARPDRHPSQHLEAPPEERMSRITDLDDILRNGTVSFRRGDIPVGPRGDTRAAPPARVG